MVHRIQGIVILINVLQSVHTKIVLALWQTCYIVRLIITVYKSTSEYPVYTQMEC